MKKKKFKIALAQIKIEQKNIDKNLLDLCELRLKNPSYSLKELADILKISKSGVNHRFKKIIEMANKI